MYRRPPGWPPCCARGERLRGSPKSASPTPQAWPYRQFGKIETGAVVEPGYFTVLALMGALGISPADLASTSRAETAGP